MATAWVPTPPTGTFADRLRLLRFLLGGLSVEQAAKLCGQPVATWRTWEHGARPRNPERVASVARIASPLLAEDESTVRDWLMWGRGPTQEPAAAKGDNSRPMVSQEGAYLSSAAA